MGFEWFPFGPSRDQRGFAWVELETDAGPLLVVTMHMTPYSRADEIEEGMRVRVDVDRGRVEVIDTGQSFEAVRLPEEIGAILRAGGLVPRLKEQFAR